ncbi:IS3 family transposase [Puniceicoccus vermicola]|uniref:Transposase n=1 Tax=Puniceicoccus vermicola TaxID=388746 RepID=A0A7X1AZ14_9BACT|nr:IS3 family transposase [Puniceicoccus vermicola]MBC2602522.1 transposase [Puniceicoccus vermicola]
MVSPERKRRTVASVLEEGPCSMRRACRYLGLARSSYYYRGLSKSDYEKALVERVGELSLKHPCYGYRRIRALLVREGWRVSRKKVQRLRRAEGLQGKRFTKKKRPRGTSTAESMVVAAEKANDVWSWDFIFDTTENGKSVKILSLVDEATCYCIDLHVDLQISSAKVLEVLDAACKRHGRRPPYTERQRAGVHSRIDSAMGPIPPDRYGLYRTGFSLAESLRRKLP